MTDRRAPVTHVVSRVIVLLVLGGLLAGLFATGLPVRFGEQAVREILTLMATVWRLGD